MTSEEINIAIAQTSGWTFGPTRTDGIPEWHRPDGSVCNSGVLPDFCNDLNAMHEAEEMLGDVEKIEWAGRMNELFHGPKWSFNVIHATARQRAQAFLRVKGLWKD